MIRHYYVTEDLDELEKVEQELESQGFTEPQIHVLSENDTEVENHHLHEVESVLKQDVVHSTEVGAIVGILGAACTLIVAYAMGWTASAVGWMPFIFLAIIVLGFCTWEGGFIGIQKPNINFERFQELLHKGKHVLFVDVDPDQEDTIAAVMRNHPHLQVAGIGEATPHWVVRGQDKFRSFMKSMP
ncbi:MAG: NAD/FAD-utilizing enzyme [Alteromonadaceae bacterium]|nr:NAD/FAD-utilizing enzyme [Alteromonadaceae bacterium]